MLVDSASHSLTFLGRGACDVCPGSPELKVTGLSQTVSNSPITRRFSESFAGTYRGNSLGNEPLQHQSHAFKHGECQTSSHQQKTWRAAHVDLVRRTGLKKEETAQVSDRHLLLLNLRGNAERGEYFLDNRKAGFISRKPGTVLFIPSGCHWQGWEVGASSAAYLAISVDPAYLNELFASTSAEKIASFSPDLGFEDQDIMNAARGIGAEVSYHNTLSGMLAEAYVATIFVQLMRRQKRSQYVKKGGLAAASLNRVIQKIEDELTEGVSLSQLAEVAGLSVPHFCRAFKQSFGCPPYEFIIRRRIERAKEYLRGSKMTITDIALSCGFSSSSHFSNTFRREEAASPLEYRAAWS
ncbi:AraC family transcriptional regulator (plasmid) [Agrobacterium tumefaciens]|nr:AraC family transcriptional regulator [Agrobacterium tumefaciens]QAB01111.1 AraC family transcriptional regulator [Agrobacterium tumefaciens]